MKLKEVLLKRIEEEVTYEDVHGNKTIKQVIDEVFKEAETKQFSITDVGICLEKKEKKLLTMLLAKDINNLSNIVEDNELLEGYKTDYRKLTKKISEA